MKRAVKAAVSGGLNYKTDVDADFYDIINKSDFPADVVNDLEDVVRDFDTRVSNVLDCFEENFDVRPNSPSTEVFAIGSDNINVTMLSSSFARDVQSLLASAFQTDLSAWARRTKDRMKNSEYYVDVQNSNEYADGKAAVTLTLEED